MKKKYLMLAVFALCLLQSLTPLRCFAFETRRVVLVGPVDTANYQSEEINKLVNERWKRVFRYPFYEVVAETQKPGAKPDKTLLMNLAQQHQADIVVSAEFARLHSRIYTRGFWDDETWQETYLRLVIHTYQVDGQQLKTFSVSRSQEEPVTAYNGAYQLMDDAMDEVLQKIPFRRVPE